MGKIDATAKEYLGSRERFAEMFNYALYNGEKVIDPNKLREINPNETIIVREDGRKLPVQRARDLLDEWEVYQDDHAVYVLLGEELQGKVHYAMPVKDMLYDGIDYAAQVTALCRKNRKESTGAEVEYTDDGVKLKLTGAEFLSGLRAEDRLKPIITLNVYLGEGEWKGPRELHDLFEFPDERLKKFVPNYKLNLIEPARMSEADFEKFEEDDLGFFLRVLKHQSDGTMSILEEPRYEKVDLEAANAANEIANLGLNIVVEEGVANMCKAIRERDKEREVIGSFRSLRRFVTNETEILKMVADDCNVDPAFVRKVITVNGQQEPTNQAGVSVH